MPATPQARVMLGGALVRIFQSSVYLYVKLAHTLHASIKCETRYRLEETRDLVHLLKPMKDLLPRKAPCWPILVAVAGPAGARVRRHSCD